MTLIRSCFLLIFCIGGVHADGELVTSSQIKLGNELYERSVSLDAASGELLYEYVDRNKKKLNKKELMARHPAKDTQGMAPLFASDLENQLIEAGIHDDFTVIVSLSRVGLPITKDLPNHSMMNENKKERLERRKSKVEKDRKDRKNHFAKILRKLSKPNMWNLISTSRKFSQEDVKISFEDRGVAILSFSKEELMDIKENGTDLIHTISLTKGMEMQVGNALISSKIDPYALNTPGHSGNGIGVIMSEEGCPSQGILPNYHLSTPAPVATPDEILHSIKVAEVIRESSPDSYITCGDWSILPPFTSALSPNGSHGSPQMYVYNGSWIVEDSNIDSSYSFIDGQFDQFAYENKIFSVLASGNDGHKTQGISTFVGSPGKGFNMMTVGYHTNAHTMALQSSYSNPITRTEKPEMVAPGSLMVTVLDPNPRGGSSFATPQVSGSAANLIGADADLQFSPHAVKALMLTGATREITIYNSTTLASVDRVGEGGLDYERVHDDSKYKVHQWNGASHTAFNWYAQNDGGVSSNYIEYHVWIPQRSSQHKVRAALSWLVSGHFADSQPNWHQKIGSGYNLFAFSPSGTYLGGSWDYFDSYSVFDFVASESGWYKFWIDREYQRDPNEELNLAIAVNWADRE